MSKQSESVRNQIILTLVDGKFHSGEELGESLGITRAAISKYMKSLQSLGLDIYSVTGKGYRLATPLELLDQEVIQSLRQHSQDTPLEVLNIVDSTNQFLKQKIGGLRTGHACVAEAQTAGRGRHGRNWISPFGANLYYSMYWRFDGGYQALSGLSLVVGVAIANSLNLLGVADVQLKWPNDVYVYGRKLAGVLVEVEGQIGGHCDCVMGIGINVAMPKDVNGITQPWIDLEEILGERIDRNRLCAVLADELITVLQQFEREQLTPFIQRWCELDCFRMRPIHLINGKQTISGIGRGIDKTGALLLEQNGQIKPYVGGEISVRSAE